MFYDAKLLHVLPGEGWCSCSTGVQTSAESVVDAQGYA